MRHRQLNPWCRRVHYELPPAGAGAVAVVVNSLELKAVTAVLDAFSRVGPTIPAELLRNRNAGLDVGKSVEDVLKASVLRPILLVLNAPYQLTGIVVDRKGITQYEALIADGDRQCKSVLDSVVVWRDVRGILVLNPNIRGIRVNGTQSRVCADTEGPDAVIQRRRRALHFNVTSTPATPRQEALLVAEVRAEIHRHAEGWYQTTLGTIRVQTLAKINTPPYSRGDQIEEGNIGPHIEAHILEAREAEIRGHGNVDGSGVEHGRRRAGDRRKGRGGQRSAVGAEALAQMVQAPSPAEVAHKTQIADDVLDTNVRTETPIEPVGTPEGRPHAEADEEVRIEILGKGGIDAELRSQIEGVEGCVDEVERRRNHTEARWNCRAEIPNMASVPFVTFSVTETDEGAVTQIEMTTLLQGGCRRIDCIRRR